MQRDGISPHLPAFVTIISFVTVKNCFHNEALSRRKRGSSACPSGTATLPSCVASRCSSSAECTTDQATVDAPSSRAAFRVSIYSCVVRWRVARCLVFYTIPAASHVLCYSDTLPRQQLAWCACAAVYAPAASSSFMGLILVYQKYMQE